jgi:hypothetical protein
VLDPKATPGVVDSRRPADETRFSVRVPSGSVLDAVNAIALAHGRTSWLLATLAPEHPGVSFYAPGGVPAIGGLLLKPIDLQAEYVGKLKPDLQSTNGQPSCRLDLASPEQVAALPVNVRSAKMLAGTLKVPWLRQGLSVALVEPAAGDPAVYVDFDANGQWTVDERLASSERPPDRIGRLVLPSQGFIYQLPLPATSPWKFLPLIVVPGWTTIDSESAPDLVSLEGGIYVEGSVPVDGREILVRYWDDIDPLTGTIDPTQGRVEMDVNGDGQIDSGPYGLESEMAGGKPVVFRVGTHYLSTKSADARTGTIVLREHPATDYVRIPLPTTVYRLPTTDYRLPTTDYRLPTTDHRLPIRPPP